jgi:hypothetical protein
MPLVKRDLVAQDSTYVKDKTRPSFKSFDLDNARSYHRSFLATVYHE